MDPSTMSTDELIRYAMGRFRAERRQRFVHAGGRGMHTHAPGERVLFLPNGGHVKVSVDDSGHATQVEEDEKLHGIARPAPIRASFGMLRAAAAASTSANPGPIKTSVIPRRNR